MAGANSTPSDFYVYVHRRATDGRVFYVGKGQRKRAFSRFGRSIYWNRIAKKYGHTVEIVQDGMQEWWAFELECELIAYYGKPNLCNMTDGGEGASGLKPSYESIKKRANAIRGKKRPAHVALAVSNAHKGKPLTKEHKEKLSKAFKGRKGHQNSIEAMRASRLGAKATELTKSKISFKSKLAMSNPSVIKKIKIANCKIVVCSNEMYFFGTNDAAKWLRENTKWTKAGQQNIVNCCNGKSKTAYGYTWKYQDENT